MMDVIVNSGRSVVELALFVLLPIMVVMLSIMRLLEMVGFLDWVVRKFTPILKPAGLTGLSLFAMIQVSFISFAAPISTLITMERRGVSDRSLAATLAMVLAMAQANVIFPLASFGLDLGKTLVVSLLGGIVASTTTYYLVGSFLSSVEMRNGDSVAEEHGRKSAIAVINEAGREALQIALGIIPMVTLALILVTVIRNGGGDVFLATLLDPALRLFSLDASIVLPTMTKYIAGGTAVLGLLVDSMRRDEIDVNFINAGAGWLINSLDVPGVAILLSVSPRISKVWKPAILGAMVGVGVRTVSHILLAR